jgi:hypothetical protein
MAEGRENSDVSIGGSWRVRGKRKEQSKNVLGSVNDRNPFPDQLLKLAPILLLPLPLRSHLRNPDQVLTRPHLFPVSLLERRFSPKPVGRKDRLRPLLPLP